MFLHRELLGAQGFSMQEQDKYNDMKTYSHNSLVRNGRRALALGLTLIFVFFVVSSRTLAYTIERVELDGASNRDFAVTPAKVELDLNHGERRIVNIRVLNRLGEAKTFRIDLEDIKGTQNLEEPAALMGIERGPYSLRDYLTVGAKEFDLRHGEQATVPIEIFIPTDAEAGGKYGSVLISTVSNSRSKSSPTITRLGVLFFVRVAGESHFDGRFTGFTTNPDKKLLTDGPIGFRLFFENKGSVHTNPYGDVRIKNIFGEEVGFLILDPWFVLPGSLRLREVLWDREFLFGKFTATASVNRGYSDIVDVRTTSFWVIPWGLMVTTFLLIFLIIFTIYFLIFLSRKRRLSLK